MDSNLYFYYGIAQQWLLANGAKSKATDNKSEKKQEPVKVKYFDELPKGYW